MTSVGSSDEPVAITPSTEVELFSVAGHDGYLREVNEAFAHLLGLLPEEINGRSLLELVHPDDIGGIVSGLAALEGGAREVLLENRFMQRDGHWVHLQWVARPVPDTDLWWASGRDTTEFHRLLAERVDLRARLDLALGTATAAMWELDLAGGVFTWEQQAAEILGVSDRDMPTTVQELAAAAHPEDNAGVLVALEGLAASGVVEVGIRVGQDAAVRYLSLRGKVLDRDRRGRALRAVGLLLDISTEKAMEEQMLRMIMSDGLTGAPNRRAFDQALRGEWRRCKRALEPLSVLMVDIDNFKAFNDNYGHLVGDDALVGVARALTAVVNREGDLLARFGGEEFAAVLPGTDTNGALTLANRMLEAVRGIVLRQAAGRAITISVGTATWLPDGTAVKAPALLARADRALYAAKSHGKDQAVAYEHSIAARDAYVAAIALGLDQGEFELYYQPVIALSTGDALGFEALMRWDRPGYGLVSPDDFIPAAEASALICDLDRFALRQAACQLATWTRDGVDPGGVLRMAVNGSGRHVSSPTIVADVQAALDAAGIAPERLELELTETALVDSASADTHLASVRALGVAVAIDDFGTGYTSVGQLPHLPIDTLKIDRSFVSSSDPRQRGLMKLMVEAAHTFNLRVVAEGIEDTETLAFLRDLGCDSAQGFLMARPMPARLVPSWLRAWQAGNRDSLFHDAAPAAAGR